MRFHCICDQLSKTHIFLKHLFIKVLEGKINELLKFLLYLVNFIEVK